MKNFMGMVLFVSLILNGCGGGSSGTDKPEKGEVLKKSDMHDVMQIEDTGILNEKNYFLKNDGTVYVATDGFDNPVKIEGLENIRKIAVGDNDQILALDNNNNVYVFGSNNNYELGLGHQNEITHPQKNDNLTDIRDICTGHDMSVAVKNDGTVYSWGYGESGTLGYTKTNYQETPRKIDGLANIVRVSCGASHTIALDESGNAYSWGKGENGRLGLGDEADSITPRKIPDLPPIQEVSLGYDYSLLLDATNIAYGFGNGLDGQLSLGNWATDAQTTPEKVSGVNNISQISAGYNHSLFLDDKGNVYSSGKNSDSSKLGFGNNNYGKYSSTQAIKIPGLSHITYIHAGNDSSSFINDKDELLITQEQQITYPESASSNKCGGFVGNWTRTDGVTLSVNTSCSALIIQHSLTDSSVLKTYLSNIEGDGKMMSYTIVKMELDGVVRQSGKHYSDVPYSIEGNTLRWGGYTYTK